MIFGVSHVYFIQEMGPDRRIKIGVSTQGDYRVAGVRTWCPYDAKLIASVPGDKVLERCLHQRFARDRMNGEWFMPSPELLALIADTLSPNTTREATFLDQSFGNSLSSFRRNLGLTQKEMAVKLQIRPSAISTAERSRKPSTTIACRLYELNNNLLPSSKAPNPVRSNA